MEDPSVEWKIEEYSSSEDGQSKASWFLNRGLELGKKIVITGIVISSAPLVLPPLVVISALGFAFSVPLGVIFASYACTKKVMSKLLPRQAPPLMLEDGTQSTNEEEEETMGFGGDFDMGKEEVEMRIEAEVLPEDEEYYVQQGVEKDEPEPMEDVDETVKEQGYEEDVGEYLDSEDKEPLEGVVVKIEGTEEEGAGESLIEESKGDQLLGVVKKDEQQSMEEDIGSVKVEEYEEDVGEYFDREDEEPLEGIDVKIEGMKEERGEGSLIEESKDKRPLDVHQVVVVVEGDEKNGSRDEAVPIENKEQAELVRETTALLEKIRDEGNADTTVEDDKLPGLAEEREQKNVRRVEEMEKLCEDKKMKKLSGEMKGKQDDWGNEAIPKDIEVREMRNEANVDIVPMEVKLVGEVEAIIEGNRDGKNVDNSLEVKKTIADSNGRTNGRRLGGVMESVIEEEQKLVVDKKAVMQGASAKDYIDPDMHKVLQFTKEKENVIHSNADLREIADESGLDLFEDSNEASDQYSYIVYENPEESMNATDIAAEGSADFMEPPASAGLPKYKYAGIITEKDTEILSNQVLLNEEKIWEQIDALRTIVGYKATPHPTCMEELKALYIFTGVEPPAVFKVASDLVEVNNKLRFLMSIVGVK
ncbi:hypothetical protein F0562_025591 [Nyssa sinensis]|uniref:Uncharacterized protein n=1 Tax=Nyssa sinensis TaxID=561372 RepID=A0A5J5B884_9ASTE|nr:hypothetical protein F0562_025591 [Nyssa sinensis]